MGAFAEHTLDDLTTWRINEVKRCQRLWASKWPNRSKIPVWVGWWPKFLLWYQDTTPVKSIIDTCRWDEAPAMCAGPGWVRRVWSDLRLACRASRFQRTVISLVFAVVWISNTGYTVSINLTAEANDWGFGQIFSMVAAVPFFASLAKLVLQLGVRDG